MRSFSFFLLIIMLSSGVQTASAQGLQVFCSDSYELDAQQFGSDEATIALVISGDFPDWLDGFRYTSSCNATATDLSGFTPPPPSGGTTTITYRVTDDCGNDETCTASFTVVADLSTTIILNCPEDVVLTDCSSQAKIDSAWNAWKSSFTFIAPPGSNVVATDLSVESAPNCGSSKSITFMVEDRSNPAIAPVECTRTFVLPPSALINPLEGIPTLGEWGIIALLIVLLTIAIVSMKSRVPSKAKA